MSVDDYLRTAWQAQREGHSRLREAMLTLAIGESDPSEGWVERGRAQLLSERPEHFLGARPTVAEALRDLRVIASIKKLRGRYPLAKVQWLRLRSEVLEGPYTGKTTPAKVLLDELIGPAAEAALRRDAPEPSRGPFARSRSAVGVNAGFAASRSAFDSRYGRVSDGDESVSPSVPDSLSDLLAEAAYDESASLYLGVFLWLAFLLAILRDGDGRRAG